jgi:ribose-phosphate pyrophosphokinase
MKIISGISAQVLTARIAKELGCEVSLCQFKKFPDGELYSRVETEIKDEPVTIVQSIITDTDLVCLLQLIEAVQEEAESVKIVIPYLGYARQDKRFEKGEAISAKAIARSVSVAGVVDAIYVVNVHNKAVLKYFDVHTVDLDVSSLIGSYISKNIEGIGEGQSVVIIGPDEGAAGLAKAVASPFGFDNDVLEKKRISGNKVEIKPKKLNVEGKNVVIVDDIISTGGTISEAAYMLRKQKAKDIYVACVHGVFIQNAILRLYNSSIKDIIATDTIATILSKISVAKTVAVALR